MKFFSASQDFQQSLNALPRLLSRLNYVSALHEAEGYAHWGLIRTHGRNAAERAMQQAHETLFVDLLRTPLRELAATANSEEVQGLNTPEVLSGGSRRHFNSIVMALSYFSEADRARRNPAA